MSTTTRTHPRRALRSVRSAAVFTACVAAGAAVPACGQGQSRSVQTYCSTIRSEQERLSAKYEQLADDVVSSEDALSGLVGVLAMTAGAQGDLVVYFDRVAKTAPDEIQPEAEAVRDGFEEMADETRNVLSDPLGTLAGGLINGFQLQGPLTDLNNYTQTNCNISI